MIPKLTDNLKDNHKRIWKWLHKLLKDAGKWKSEYEPHFEVLVDACVEYFDVQHQIAAARAAAIRAGNPGLAYMLKNPSKGTLYPNPLVNHRSNLVNTIRQYGNAFGLNPLAEAKIKSVPTGSDMGELLKLMLVGKDES